MRSKNHTPWKVDYLSSHSIHTAILAFGIYYTRTIKMDTKNPEALRHLGFLDWHPNWMHNMVATDGIFHCPVRLCVAKLRLDTLGLLHSHSTDIASQQTKKKNTPRGCPIKWSLSFFVVVPSARQSRRFPYLDVWETAGIRTGLPWVFHISMRSVVMW